MKEFNDFYRELVSQGMYDSEKSIMVMFQGEIPEMFNISYHEAKGLFENIANEHGFAHIEDSEGEEGDDGTEYFRGVIKVGEKYYSAEWSHYFLCGGYDYDGITNTIREVKPVEKTIIVYE